MQATEPKQADGGVQARTGLRPRLRRTTVRAPRESTSGDQSKEYANLPNTWT